MENVIKLSRDTACVIVKWKVKVGSRIAKNTLLALYKDVTSEKQDKLKSSCVGTVKELLVGEGESVPPGGIVLCYEGCQHPIVMKDMCAECGADLREKDGLPGSRKSGTSASVAMVHSVPELIVSEEQAKSLGRADEERLLKSRKLVLLVDLDQTLIHTTNDNVPANLKDVYHFQLWHGRQLLWYHTRFRPGTEDFLRAVSEMYELHICTFGARVYAHTIARFLDPKGEFFSHRILSRDECFNISSKTANLKALFPCGDSMVCIIDDREDVWNFIPSLVHVKPYSFFEGTADINAPPGMEKGKKKDPDGKSSSRKQERKSRIVRVPKKTKKEETSDSNSKDTKADVVSLENKAAVDVDSNHSEKEDSGNTKVKDSANEKGDADGGDTQMEEHTEKVTDSGDAFEDDCKVSDDSEEEEKEDTDIKTSESKDKEEDMETDRSDREGKSDQEESEQKDSAEKSNKDSSPKKEDLEDGKSQENTEESENDAPDDKTEYEEMVEWIDEDDYLIYLQDILTRIHKAFFQMYDEAKDKNGKEPDLKTIIPYIRKKILKGANIIFSGVFPTNMPMEKSRAYNVAKALGANVHTAFVSKEQAEKKGGQTTHVIAVRAGTHKVNQAAKHKGVLIVKPDWLWSCNDRWEKVDERLFLLPVDMSKLNEREVDSPKPPSKKKQKTKQEKEAEATTSAQIAQRRFSENPMYAMSSEDIADMGKEVDELLSDEDDDDDDDVKEEGGMDDQDEDSQDGCEKALRSKVLGHTPPDSSSDDSLDSGTPKGWKHKRKRKREASGNDEDSQDAPADTWDDDDPDEAKVKLYIEARESPRMVFKRGSESSSSDDDFNESVGSVDDEMVEALDKFLDS